MTFKKYKPITSSQRHLTLLNKFFLNKSPLIKSKIFGLINSSGLPTRSEVRSMLKETATLYIKNDSGEFIPVWKENVW